ncbi:hypothetical protein EGW08_003125 [Elysia chlorotica]|uniref:Uncharacterized protein n=1 Tax=Elysia chlorotica TaxID=188477 RepID=A0A3S1CCQ8_ELYCH|nr:hypothetical protein EGW08_003125 [Elysia chlorotica]
MDLPDFNQSDYQSRHPSSCHHRPHHLKHTNQFNRRQHHVHEEKPPHQPKPKQHPRFLSLLLPRSPATLMSLLILSSVWSLPSCRALDSVSPGAAMEASLSRSSSNRAEDRPGESAATHGPHSKRTILPFHFKLLQDYLQQYRGGSRGEARGSRVSRYPVEMLIPPGIRIAPAPGSHGLWWRSRRSAPLHLDNIARSMRSKAYPAVGRQRRSKIVKDSPGPYSPFSHGALAIDNIDYFEPNRLVDGGFLGTKVDNGLKLSRFKSKSFTYGAKNNPKPSSRRYLQKMRQKQKIIEALRRRDKAKQLRDASRKSKIPSDVFLPKLSEAVTGDFQDFQETKSHNSFVKKHKIKGNEDNVQTAIFFDKHEIYPLESFNSDSFEPVSNPDKESLNKAIDQEDEFLNELKPMDPNSDLNQVEWFVSSPHSGDPSPLLAASSIDDKLLQAPDGLQSPVIFEHSFETVPGDSGFGDFSSAPVFGHSLMSASSSDTFSQNGAFEGASPYTGESTFVSSSFGSGPEGGFGDVWGEGEFLSDDKDCVDIETKTCETNADCSCFGFYHCTQSGRCEAMSAGHQQQSPMGNWHDRPLGFGLSKRHAIQRGNFGSEPAPKVTVSKVTKSGSRRR